MTLKNFVYSSRVCLGHRANSSLPMQLYWSTSTEYTTGSRVVARPCLGTLSTPRRTCTVQREKVKCRKVRLYALSRD